MSESGIAPDAPTPDNAPDKPTALFKIVVGLAFGAATVYLVTLHFKQEPDAAAGAISGIAAGLALWLLVAGAANLMGKRLGKPAGFGLLIACAVAGGMIEPRVVRQRRVQVEQASWAQLQASGKTFDDYQKYHYTGVPLRRGYLGGMALAEVREEVARQQKGGTAGRVATLRRLISEYHGKARDEEPGAMQPAIDLAHAELARAYAKGLDDLAARAGSGKAGADFAPDPQMRAAFKTVLERLAKADDDHVYLVFTSDNNLSPRADASKTGATDTRTLDPGEAFSPEREGKRYRAFSKSMEEVIERGFAEPLLRLRELGEGQPREGKVIFEVRCTTRRAPGGFELKRNDAPIGTLFNLDVAWKFQVFDVDGTPLATSLSRSNPAEKFRFRSNKGDPPWAAYGVMMDSAYYNYCREITGRLGLAPPVVREVFSFER
jgi:hypothetical protein